MQEFDTEININPKRKIYPQRKGNKLYNKIYNKIQIQNI